MVTSPPCQDGDNRISEAEWTRMFVAQMKLARNKPSTMMGIFSEQVRTCPHAGLDDGHLLGAGGPSWVLLVLT